MKRGWTELTPILIRSDPTVFINLKRSPVPTINGRAGTMTRWTLSAYAWLVITLILMGNISKGCGRFFNPQFSSSMEDVTVRTGVSVQFQCVVKHLGRSWVAFSRLSDTSTLISWDMNVFAGLHNKYNVERKEDTWSLTINNVQANDAGQYMCQVNSFPPISQIADLHVNVPPLINKERSSKDTFVNEGQNATFYCSADGMPSPVYTWRRVAEIDQLPQTALIITNDPDIGTGESIIHRSNFTIFKVSRNHMANYECISSNGVEPSDSYTVKLHVLYPPEVETVQEKVYATKRSHTKLQCKARAWPRPNFVWEFNKHVITSYPEKYHMIVKANSSNHDSIATLTIRNLSDDDFGNYYCLASNDRGHHKAVVELLQSSGGEYYNHLPEDSDDVSLSHVHGTGAEEKQQQDYNGVGPDQRQTVPRSPYQSGKERTGGGRRGGGQAGNIGHRPDPTYISLAILLLISAHSNC